MTSSPTPAHWFATWQLDWPSLAHAAILALLGLGLALLAHRLLFGLIGRLVRLSETPVDDLLAQHARRPLRWIMVVIALSLAARGDAHLAAVWDPLGGFLRPLMLGWVAYTLVRAGTDALDLRLGASADPVQVRGRRTRLAILSRTATVVIVVITVGLMLFALPAVRDIGTTLLASAGLAALAVGAAAQPALKSLIAGLQMAVTEPIRLGDLVVVDGHTGRVEEIHMSYVLIRTWDERGVMVPTSRFLEQTFENWSRKNEQLTGFVLLRLHPETEVARVRTEFERFVASHKAWDKRTASLVMSESFVDYLELRLTVSSATIAQLADLKFALREHMIGWLQAEMPAALERAVVAAPRV